MLALHLDCASRPQRPPRVAVGGCTLTIWLEKVLCALLLSILGMRYPSSDLNAYALRLGFGVHESATPTIFAFGVLVLGAIRPIIDIA